MSTEDLMTAYYAILQSQSEAWDRERLGALLAVDLDFEGPIAGRVRGRDRFLRGVSGFIETQRGIRFLHRLVGGAEAAALYDAELPGGTLRFAEFLVFEEDLISAIRLLYDPTRYRQLGGR
jgi:hypothetical protein